MTQLWSRHLQWVSTQAQANADPYGVGVMVGEACLASGFAAVDLTSSLRNEPGWDATGLLEALRWAVVITAVGTGVTRVALPLRHRVFGLVERLLYAATIAFLLAVAVEAVRVLG